ncbi:pif-6 [Venturia canescens]|uniref:Pif-6 n=1 Tax=Venturia canescens TaxID=32260 RepID=A0ACB9ZJ42_9HYME|nr:uncharacterized LOC122408856 [Venturia canescens]KAI5630630.1 pif-6 [Venturia canescens]
MKLTIEEFKRIRPLQWCLKEVDGKVYNTTINQTQTRLFWIDFMRLVFAPKYARQRGVTHIGDFEPDMPVLITNDLQLELPSVLETAMYYANNQTLPKIFSVSIPQLFILIIGIVFLLGILVLGHIMDAPIWRARIL